MTTKPTVLHDEDNAPDKHASANEIIIGKIVKINNSGEPVIDYEGNVYCTPLSAISTVPVNKSHIGRQVAILFANGKLDCPVIMGLIHSPLTDMIETYELMAENNQPDKQSEKGSEYLLKQDIKVDGKKITLEGEEEVVLKCGDASITLTKAGKVLIRGKYLLNRSDGVNRIMGGSVQVN